MPADVGWALLSCLVQQRALREAQARHITSEMFPTVEQQRVYQFLCIHYRKYRVIPSMTLLAEKFPKAHLTLTVEEPTRYYLDRFVQQHLLAHGWSLLDTAAEQLHKSADPLALLEKLRAESTALLGKTGTAEDIAYAANWRSRWQDYKKRQQGELVGIPTPWQTWNDLAFGWQPEEYIVVTSRPGTGKTWFLLFCAHYATLKRLRKRVVFFTKEMSVRALERRLDAIRFHLPYNQFRRGELTPEQEERYRLGSKRKARLVKLGKLGDVTFVGDAGTSVSTIEAKIGQYEPDLVCIDGLYLLTDNREVNADWERVQNISRDLRACAQSCKVPILATSQIHRVPGNLERSWRRLSLADLAFSDALARDADQVLALIRTSTMIQARQLLVLPLKMREEAPRNWLVSWDLSTMAHTFHELPMQALVQQPGEEDRE